ncbi:MAG: right-handed parallel beta-helix repeat-containing protein [Candidatus Lernaella stagnicola]|nr:right-handed parallel beta-helix repeat-containing protein [Candidatus Lernaella stagnicola]
MRTRFLAAVILALFLIIPACADSDNNDDASPNAGDDDMDDDTSDDDTFLPDDDTTNDDDDDDNDDNDNNDNNDTSPPLPEGIYVSTEGDDANPGTPDLPMRTIEAALSVAEAADVPVRVAAGEYQASLETTVSMYGGYNPHNWRRNIAANETTIVGLFGVSLYVWGGIETETVVDGFSISATGPASGAAQTVFLDGGKITFSHNTVTGHDAAVDGYANGVSINGEGDFHILRNRIKGGNSSGEFAKSFGLSIASHNGQVNVEGNSIYGGRAVDTSESGLSCGIGVEAVNSEVLIQRNVIGAGYAQGLYAAFTDGVDIVDGEVTLVNNIITSGAAGGSPVTIAAGIHTYATAPPPLMLHNTIHPGLALYAFAVQLEGDATMIGNALHIAPGIFASVFATQASSAGRIVIIGNNLQCLGWTCVLGSVGTDIPLITVRGVNACDWPGCLEAHDNISEASAFAGMLDFHLTATSALIDAGVDPTAWYDGDPLYVDIDGEARPVGEGWDIGADEAPVAVW